MDTLGEEIGDSNRRCDPDPVPYMASNRLSYRNTKCADCHKQWADRHL